MGNILDKTGRRYGRLSVLCEAPRDSAGRVQWVCRCDCGQETVVRSLSLISDKAGTRSCGCLQREIAAEACSKTKKDRVGERVGRLVIEAEADRGRTNRPRWQCKCDCGAQVEVDGSKLYRGGATSCGCLRRDTRAALNRATATHGHCRVPADGKRKNSREYRTYQSMLQRCRNPNASNFHLYGGRGISICDEWLGDGGFERFLADMGPRPEKTTIDRFPDQDGNYEPCNCRWATPSQQSENRRMTPEREASMKSNLERGRRRMWDDPELRRKLLLSRKK